MKRVLLLAYLFPPIANSGTQRPLKFAKYLGEYGWEPTVMTAAHFDDQPTDQALLAEVPPGLRVVRVPMLNERIGGAIAAALPGGIGKHLGDAVSWRVRNWFGGADLYAAWRPTALRAALRLHRDAPFDAICATGFPWTTLLIGRDLARATGCPLVADFRDLWSGESLFRESRLTREEERALEDTVVATASYVVSPTSAMSRWFTAAYPGQPEDKFVSIHNGFDRDDLGAVDAPPGGGGPFRIVYTGVWKDGYNPSELYDSIDWIRRTQPALLDDLDVIMAGFKPGEAMRRGLDSVITELGHIPHREAVSLMRSADLLFLSMVDRERQWAVPGKLYEYLATGRPVLALVDPDKEVGQILRRVGGGVALSPEDPGTLFEAITAILRARRFDVPPRDASQLECFERRQLTARLAAVLDEATAHAPMSHTALSMGTTGSAPVLATRSS